MSCSAASSTSSAISSAGWAGARAAGSALSGGSAARLAGAGQDHPGRELEPTLSDVRRRGRADLRLDGAEARSRLRLDARAETDRAVAEGLDQALRPRETPNQPQEPRRDRAGLEARAAQARAAALRIGEEEQR